MVTPLNMPFMLEFPIICSFPVLAKASYTRLYEIWT